MPILLIADRLRTGDDRSGLNDHLRLNDILVASEHQRLLVDTHPRAKAHLDAAGWDNAGLGENGLLLRKSSNLDACRL
jgi:hypothetical protein